MPFDVGSTTVSVIAAASPASTALPPFESMARPACAASGCDVATTFFASTGMRWDEYGKSQENIRALRFRRSRKGSMLASGPREVAAMGQEISALVFDAYGTLFDVHSVTRVADSLCPGKGAQLSQAWRAKQLEYTWLRSLMGRYEDFSRVTVSSLEWAIESLALEIDTTGRRALIDEYRKLAMFPEVPAVIERLAQSKP